MLRQYLVFENRGVTTMEVSYKKLWKILIDKDMKKKDLQSSAGISWASVTKLSKGETVSMEVLMKVCKALDCNIGDIMDLIPTDEDANA
jgi:DNA-binding Xre family transcriptional regulator